MATIATLYGLSVEELLPEKSPLNVVAAFVQEADPCISTSLAAVAGFSEKLWQANSTLCKSGSGINCWTGYFGNDLPPTMPETLPASYGPKCQLGNGDAKHRLNFLRLQLGNVPL